MSCRRLRQQRLDSKDVHGPYFVKNLTVPSRHSKAVGAGGGHYAFTTTVYPDIPGHWGDVNQSLGPEKQKCSPGKVVGINHSQITFFYSENPTKNGTKGTHLSSTFSKTANLLTERR